MNVLLRMGLGLVTTGDTGEEKQLQGAVRCRNYKPNNNSIDFTSLNQKPLKCHLVPTTSVSPDGKQVGDSTYVL